jgi:hypothetical protein
MEKGGIPLECFTEEECRVMQTFRRVAIQDVTYYLWVNRLGEGALPQRFIYYVELIFVDGRTLLFTCGEDSTSIQLGSADALVGMASRLRESQGGAAIQRVLASEMLLWKRFSGQTLEEILLSKNGGGLYLNDVVLLSFSGGGILIGLGVREGLTVSLFEG